MLKVMAFLVKKQGLDAGDLIDYYDTHHVPLVLSLAPPGLRALDVVPHGLVEKESSWRLGPAPEIALRVNDAAPIRRQWLVTPSAPGDDGDYRDNFQSGGRSACSPIQYALKSR